MTELLLPSINVDIQELTCHVSHPFQYINMNKVSKVMSNISSVIVTRNVVI